MTLKPSSIETMQLWLFRVGMGLLAACVVHSATGGWALADGHWGKGPLYVVVMAGITIGAGLLPTMIASTYRAGLYFACTTLVAGYLLCLTGETIGNMMAMGHTRNTSITAANVADLQVDDRRASIKDQETFIALAEANIAQRQKAAGWLSTKPADAWKSEIANLEGDFLFKRSRQCADVTKPDSRSHCDKIKEARANLAVATAHEQEAAKLETSKTKLAKLREDARNDKPGISASRTQSDNIVRVSGLIRGEWVQAASSDSRARANFAVEMFMVVAMIIVPATMIMAGCIDWKPRPKRPGHSMVARIMAWARNKPLPEAQPEPTPTPQAMDTPQANTNLLIERHTITDAFRKDFASAYDRAKAIAKAPDLRAAA